MSKKPEEKYLKNTRLLKSCASWIYCDSCDKTVGYLCYTTYERVSFKYTCNCGNKGQLLIDFKLSNDSIKSKVNLVINKNRLCCPIDNSALIIILKDRLLDYQCQLVCRSCNNFYLEES